MTSLGERSIEDLTDDQWRGLADDADPEGIEYEQLLAGLVDEYAPDHIGVGDGASED